MLMYDHKRGMHWCLFHDDENCYECTAKRCRYWPPVKEKEGDEDGNNIRTED